MGFRLPDPDWRGIPAAMLGALRKESQRVTCRASMISATGTPLMTARVRSLHANLPPLRIERFTPAEKFSACNARMLRTGTSWGSKIGITAEGLQPFSKSSSLIELEAAANNGDDEEPACAGVSKSCIHNRAARTTT